MPDDFGVRAPDGVAEPLPADPPLVRVFLGWIGVKARARTHPRNQEIVIHQDRQGASGRFVGLRLIALHAEVAKQRPFGFRCVPGAERHPIRLFMVYRGQQSFLVVHDPLPQARNE